MYDLLNILGIAGPIAISVAGAIYSYFASRRQADEKKLVALGERMEKADLQLTAAAYNTTALTTLDVTVDQHEKRLLQLEGELKHMPGKQDVSDLKLAISELSGTVGRLEEQLKGSVGRLDEAVGSIGRTVHRIDDYLREEGKRS